MIIWYRQFSHLTCLTFVCYRDADAMVPNGASDIHHDPEAASLDTWEIWNKFRLLCHHHAKLSVALELTEDLPSEAELERWLAEPIKLVTIPSRVFQTGRRGQPALSPAHVSFLTKLFKVRFSVDPRFSICNCQNLKTDFMFWIYSIEYSICWRECHNTGIAWRRTSFTWWTYTRILLPSLPRNLMRLHTTTICKLLCNP
jgi:hypothetical protein